MFYEFHRAPKNLNESDGRSNTTQSTSTENTENISGTQDTSSYTTQQSNFKKSAFKPNSRWLSQANNKTIPQQE
jgi:hypothetical protein